MTRKRLTFLLTLLLLSAMLPGQAAGPKTRLASVGAGGVQGDGHSFGADITPNGRFVLFFSVAATLVSGDTNGVYDVFLLDRKTDKVRRMSVSSNEAESNGESFFSDLSDDGMVVAFDSEGTNLVPGDTNGVKDVFVRDRETGETRLVSGGIGGADADGEACCVILSGNGKRVVFDSEATNLVPGDTNGARDVFIHNLATGKTRRVSVNSSGDQVLAGGCCADVSANGRIVAFFSDSSELVSGDTNGAFDVFVRDLKTGKTRRVSLTSGEDQVAAGGCCPEVSDSGRLVVFHSGAPDLVPGDTNGADDVFLRDRRTGKTRRVSVRTNETQATGPSYIRGISPDGRYVLFDSDATDMVPGDTNGVRDVFVRDRDKGTTFRVSVRSNGAQANAESVGDDMSRLFVLFESEATNLVGGDSNGFWDVFVHGPLR